MARSRVKNNERVEHQRLKKITRETRSPPDSRHSLNFFLISGKQTTRTELHSDLLSSSAATCLPRLSVSARSLIIMAQNGLRSGTDWALALLRTLPRVGLNNLKPEPRHKPHGMRGQHGGKRKGGPHKGQYQRMSYPRLGFEGGQRPFYTVVPFEPYYKGHHLRRQYPPISLGQLQLLIDTNRIRTQEPIDLTALCNTKILQCYPQEKHFGFQLTDEGIDSFKAKVNIEVQWTTEAIIAAVEKNGGTITLSYYDRDSLIAATNPVEYFQKGLPIPKRMIPPEDAIEYYSDPKFRGYLADPDKIAEERLVLAQKYGYILPDIEKDSQKEMLLMRKDPRQIFFGLEPGWVVNLREKCVYKPKDEELLQYYRQ